MKTLTLLGATGSIGLQTLEVIELAKTHDVFALSANSNVNSLMRLCLKYQPRFAVMVDEQAALRLKNALSEHKCKTEILSGKQALIEIATHPEVDTVMAGIVGSDGLAPTLAAVTAGKRVLLANKEALVMTGKLFMDAARENNAILLPVDSEHNAIFQCLPVSQLTHLPNPSIKQIWLTASGGPFLNTPLNELQDVTPEQACHHPNWSMGRKISVDSATMMNKALEIIEAHWLFTMSSEQIHVVIHPQSIVHSMVEYIDGSILAQMGYPDMRTPIAHALAWPNRVVSGTPLLELFNKGGRLDFIPPSGERFPVLDLAREVLRVGGTAGAIFNAANEVAVASFLNHELSFLDIPNVIAETLNTVAVEAASELDVIIAADKQARIVAQKVKQI
ncbi:MAG: 1-deoxy-D-xylulose-5-phosphate reductoisomerase [Gammaproteobacteria bacterium]|jgi:1-deoxy-D-xylulose-5-phosphate reductoisomerase